MHPDDFQYMRSGPSRIPSFVRFYNNTKHPATLIWINREGKGVVYLVGLGSHKTCDVNSFAGHKWVFVRKATDDRLVADGRTVWVGEPWNNTIDPAHPNRAKRKLVELRKPVYSLKECCVYSIKRYLMTNHRSTAHLPTLPQNLVDDLQHPLFRHLMPFEPPAGPDMRERMREIGPQAGLHNGCLLSMAEDMHPDDFRYMRSGPSRTHSFVRFYNSTDFPATLIWINYEGKGVVYSEGLESRKWYDVNSYGGHKWVFVRAGTQERLVADGRTVWIGEPWMNSTNPAHPNRARRKLVQLSKPLYTLRECAVYTIKKILAHNNKTTNDLPALPQNLVNELRHPLFRHLMPFTPLSRNSHTHLPPEQQRAADEQQQEGQALIGDEDYDDMDADDEEVR